MTESKSQTKIYQDNKSLLDDVLGSSARLYRIKIIKEVGDVYFFFNLLENRKSHSWKLSLLSAPGNISRISELDIKAFLTRTVNQELKGLSYPEKIDILIPHVLENDSEIVVPQAHWQSLNKTVNLVEMILPNWEPENLRTRQSEISVELDSDLVVRPLATKLLVIFLSIVFLLQTIMSYINSDFLQIGTVGVNSINLALGNYTELFAGTLIHGNLVHFVMNLMALYYLGLHLSRFYGFTLLMLIYSVSTVTGVFGSLALARANSIGASGAIFGLLGALIIALLCVKPKTKVSPYWTFQFQSLLRSLYICLLLSLFIPIIVPRIDIWGHLGGFLGGVFISLQFFQTRRSWKLGSWIVLIGLAFPWWYQLKQQYSWANKIIDQRQSQKAAAERLVIEMNGRLSDIVQSIKVFLDFRPTDVQALHSKTVDTMRVNFDLVSQRKEFSQQELLIRYFACIEEALEKVTRAREPDYSRKWREQYSILEKEVMQRYGLARSGDTQ